MDSELFYGFFNQLLIPRTRPISGPKLLILDGQRSHLDIKSVELFQWHDLMVNIF